MIVDLALDFLSMMLLPFAYGGIGDTGKAMALAEQALAEPSMFECLSALRMSIINSPLYRHNLMGVSTARHVPEDPAGFLAYFRDTFLPANRKQLERISSWKFIFLTDLLIGFFGIASALGVVMGLQVSNSVLPTSTAPVWTFLSIAASVTLLIMTAYPFLLKRAAGRSAAYIGRLEEVIARIEGEAEG